MIEANLLRTRTRDGVKVYAHYSMAYIEKATNKFVSEIPAGASESDYQMTFCGCLRQTGTGKLYEIAQDVEDSPNTYDEVFPDPADASCWNTYGPIFSVYPEYKASEEYSEGDKTVYDGKTWISDFDNNTGNTPNVYGWSEYLPYIEKVEPTYKTLEELYPETEQEGEDE